MQGWCLQIWQYYRHQKKVQEICILPRASFCRVGHILANSASLLCTARKICLKCFNLFTIKFKEFLKLNMWWNHHFILFQANMLITEQSQLICCWVAASQLFSEIRSEFLEAWKYLIVISLLKIKIGRFQLQGNI